LKTYDGTLVFVSHDRWFVSQLATRIFEISPRASGFPGHLRGVPRPPGRRPPGRRGGPAPAPRPAEKEKAKGNGANLDDRERQRRQKDLAKRRDEVTRRSRRPSRESTRSTSCSAIPPSSIDLARQGEEARRGAEELSTQVEGLMGEWEGIESALGELGA